MRSLFWIAPVLSAVLLVEGDHRPDDVVVALHDRMRVLRKDSIKRRILAELKLQTEPRWSSSWPSQGEIEKILGTQLVGDGLPTNQPIRRTTRSPSTKSGAEMSYKFSFPIKSQAKCAMTRSGVCTIKCVLLLLLVGLLSVCCIGGHHGRQRRSDSDATTNPPRSSEEMAAAAVRDRGCVLTNRTVSVEPNVTQYHCDMQGIRSEELAKELLVALKMDSFPNSSTIQSCRDNESMRRVLEQEGFHRNGMPKNVPSRHSHEGGDCDRLNYHAAKSGCIGPACDGPVLTTHRVLQSVRRGAHPSLSLQSVLPIYFHSQIFLEIEVAEKESVEYKQRVSRTEPNDCSLEPSEYNATCCRYSLEVRLTYVEACSDDILLM
uniref:Uncharacterized protein n=1 Tax=Plectus sambesii TaxID=2011161 RepID=A0A914XAN1_9BILA